MLNIKLQRSEDTLVCIDQYFDPGFDRTWLMDPFAKKFIEETDRCKVLSGGAFINTLGKIYSPAKLSTGLKTLLLLLFEPSLEYDITNCGDNCAKWVLEIAKRHDLTVVLRRVMNFGPDFLVCVEGRQVHNMEEYVTIFEEEFL